MCLKVDEDGVITEGRRQCQSDLGCNVGPVPKINHDGEVEERWYFEQEQDQLASRACQVEYTNRAVTPRDCSEEWCSLRPVAPSLQDGDANAFFGYHPPRDDLVSVLTYLYTRIYNIFIAVQDSVIVLRYIGNTAVIVTWTDYFTSAGNRDKECHSIVRGRNRVWTMTRRFCRGRWRRSPGGACVRRNSTLRI